MVEPKNKRKKKNKDRVIERWMLFVCEVVYRIKSIKEGEGRGVQGILCDVVVTWVTLAPFYYIVLPHYTIILSN